MARGPGIFGSIGLFILRVGVSSFMLMHGWTKTLKVMEGDFAFADPIGIGQETSLVLAAGAEFACAILVMLGLGTRFAAIPLAFTMIVAAFAVHANDPLFAAGGASKEPALVFGIVYTALIFTGAGWFSADGLIRTLVAAKRHEARLEEDERPDK
jgi:putative oxidoreductase